MTWLTLLLMVVAFAIGHFGGYHRGYGKGLTFAEAMYERVIAKWEPIVRAHQAGEDVRRQQTGGPRDATR